MLLRDISGFNGWKWESISFDLPKSLALEIKATLFPLSVNVEDRIAWAIFASGDFVLKEAYNLARDDDSGVDPPCELDWVWKVPTIPKIQCFIWQCCHLSIPTRSVLIARGMNLPNHCPICNEGNESIIHLLRDYPLAKELWNSLHPPPPPMATDAFYGNNPMTWIRYNYHCTRPSSTLGISWNVLFSFGL